MSRHFMIYWLKIIFMAKLTLDISSSRVYSRALCTPSLPQWQWCLIECVLNVCFYDRPCTKHVCQFSRQLRYWPHFPDNEMDAERGGAACPMPHSKSYPGPSCPTLRHLPHPIWPLPRSAGFRPGSPPSSVGHRCHGRPAGRCSKCPHTWHAAAALPGPVAALEAVCPLLPCRASVPWSPMPSPCRLPWLQYPSKVFRWARCRHPPLKAKVPGARVFPWPLGPVHRAVPMGLAPSTPPVRPTIIKVKAPAHLIVAPDLFTVLQLWGRR